MSVSKLTEMKSFERKTKCFLVYHTCNIFPEIKEMVTREHEKFSTKSNVPNITHFDNSFDFFVHSQLSQNNTWNMTGFWRQKMTF